MVHLTISLFTVLDKVADEVALALINLDGNKNITNKTGIDSIDISEKESMFMVRTAKSKGHLGVSAVINNFFPGEFSKDEIVAFTKKYNKVKATEFGYQAGPPKTPIDVVAKKANYKNVRETFLSFVTETYPHGFEEEVMHLMPSNLEKDKFGNYYKIIGNSDVMFTSHLDTASYKKSKINLFSFTEGSDEFICTDGTTILGADDKAGVAVMLYMMEHNIPGIYYFFMGEERGCIGSSAVASELESFPFLNGVKKVISFDRRNYHSIITYQMGGVCCSDEFAKELASALNAAGMDMKLDPTGILTDSACFMDDMPEITNISVGYFNEHTGEEVQNMTFLIELAEACVKVDWNSIKTYRKVGIAPELLDKYKKLMNDCKKYSYDSENKIKVMGEGDSLIVKLEVSEASFDAFYKDMSTLNSILLANKQNPDIVFDQSKMKFKFK